MKNIFLSLRPKQWIKNLFIFLPLIFGKKLFIFPVNLQVAFAFILFSMTAGVVYLINDIMDIEKDKVHPTKRLRPVPSGRLSVKNATIAACILGIISISASFALNINFGFLILAYIVLNFIYTKSLKRFVIIDVFCISAFFLLRIFAGSIVADVVLSHWIMFMTALLALFLGFNKRRQELRMLEKDAVHHRGVLAKYNSYFIDQMIGIVTASVVVVYMLYAVDERTVREFGTNHLMYSIPFVYYGIFRYLYLIHKLGEDGDPTHMLLKDRDMQVNLVLWIFVCVGVIYFGL